MSASETTPATRGPARQVLKFGTIADVMMAAEYVFMSGNLPAGCDNKFKVFVMLLAGMEVGFGVSQSMAWITPPVNGKCSIYGDGGLALIRSSGLLEKFEERFEGTGDERTAVVTVKRRGFPERSFTYTMALAKKLKSYKSAQTRGGPWADDPDNMLQWRARWRAFRTEFTDVLGGMIGAEEAEDYVTVDAVVVSTAQPALPAATTPALTVGPSLSDAQFAEFARLRQLVRDAHDGDGSAEWKAHLQPFAADSVKALTTEQADQFLSAVGRQYDPFTYPPASQPALPQAA